jgi:hypothetical protein
LKVVIEGDDDFATLTSFDGIYGTKSRFESIKALKQMVSWADSPTDDLDVVGGRARHDDGARGMI